MKFGTVLVIGFLAIAPLQAAVYPQTGIEFTGGSNQFLNISPWAGIRLGVSSQMSVLLKYFYHNIAYVYSQDEGEEVRQNISLSNFTSAVYYQGNVYEGYAAFSYFLGKDYRALALDVGLEKALNEKLKAEAGVYYLREDSTLWFPDEEKRTISIISLKGGVKYKVNKWMTFNPRVHVYRNSEDVLAFTLSAGIIFSTGGPLSITVYYLKYSESARYRFSGDYISAGFNVYY